MALPPREIHADPARCDPEDAVLSSAVPGWCETKDWHLFIPEGSSDEVWRFRRGFVRGDPHLLDVIWIREN
jgi:hypothetical protein